MDLQNKTIVHLKDNLAIYLILVLGFMIRLYGIQFGLPGLYHADEPMVVNHAVAYSSWDFNPHYFKLPPLLSYSLFFLYGIYFVLGYIVNVFNSISEFEMLFLTDPSSFYLIGRMVFGVIFGTATIYLVYLLALQLCSDKKVALLSALFLALSFLHVRNSHYIYHDIPMVFFVVLASISMCKLYKRQKVVDYILTGLYAGIAAGFKYNAALLCISILLTHILKDTKLNLKIILLDGKIYICGLVMIITYLITNPFSVISFNEFAREFVALTRSEESFPFLFHLRYSLVGGLGLPVVLASIGGIFWIIVKYNRYGIVIFSFPIIYYFFCSFVSQGHARYVIPLIPFFAISVSFFICKIFQSRSFFKKRHLLLCILTFFVVLPTLLKSFYIDYLFASGDTRTQAKVWIEKNIPYNTKIAFDHGFFTPRLYHSNKQLESKLEKANSKLQKKRIKLLLENTGKNPKYNLFYLANKGELKSFFLFQSPIIENKWENIYREGIQYIVIHKRKKEDSPLYLGLDKYAELVKTFSPYKDKNKIYSLDVDVNTAAPFFAKEIYSRRSLGYTIQIYRVL
jgi:4-amino-4-deoxy-L-arabinose transferase-like glycosyltransferase